MIPNFLFPQEQVNGVEGEGSSVSIENAMGQLIQLTLGITDAIEQESLDVLVYGSADNETWTAKPLATFPQKFYKGVYTILLDLSGSPELQYLKIKYKAIRWGHWSTGPSFEFYVFADPLGGEAA